MNHAARTPAMTADPASPPRPIRLLLVDDHFVVRSGLVASLEIEDDLDIAGEAASTAEAIRQIAALKPDVVLTDLRLPDQDGIELVGAVPAPKPRFLIYSTYARDEDIYRAVRAGADGYLLKTAPREELISAIRTVAEGRKFLPPDVANRLASRLNEPSLTPRELDVVRRIGRGMANKIIAADLGIAEETVKQHVSSVLAKLGAKDRAQAVTEAMRRGWIALDE